MKITKKDIEELLEKGKSPKEIQKVLNISKTSYYRCLRNGEIDTVNKRNGKRGVFSTPGVFPYWEYFDFENMTKAVEGYTALVAKNWGYMITPETAAEMFWNWVSHREAVPVFKNRKEEDKWIYLQILNIYRWEFKKLKKRGM